MVIPDAFFLKYQAIHSTPRGADMDEVRIGIIGCGNMGGSHASTIDKGEINGLRLVAVADRSESRRTWAKENLHTGISVFSEGSELIASHCCDAVIIATPHYQHPSLGILALENGLHVLSEKPAGVYTKQVRELNEVAQKSDKTFAMMFNQRTNHLYRKMRELVQSGAYGEIKRVNWIITEWYRTQTYYNSGSWRASWVGEGGGVLLNQCPHQLDLLQWICGLPVEVRAFCHEGKWHDIEVEDDVTAYMEFANGATGVFVTSTADAPGTNRFEITLTKGKIVCENNTLRVWQLAEDERSFCKNSPQAFGGPECKEVTVETDGMNLQHKGVMQAFADHILTGSPLVADGKEGINGLMLSNAMHLSSWLNKTVSLPVDEDLFFEELNKKCATSKLRVQKKETMMGTKGSFGSQYNA
jgi:predicted dehydrogenase